ncbi:MAG: hypothetical protein AB1413_04685 [Thermodesulfobacteriota bacterium]
MEQTRSNYHKMMGFGIATIAAGTVAAVCIMPLWKTIVPMPQGRENLYEFIPMVLGLCALIGGLRGALAIQARLLDACGMDEEERQRMRTYGPESRRMLDRALMGLALVCVFVLLCSL